MSTSLNERASDAVPTFESPFPFPYDADRLTQVKADHGVTKGMKIGWRVVQADFTSRGGYRWTFPGQWAESDGIPDDWTTWCELTRKQNGKRYTKGQACPQVEGDGLCLAKTFSGASSGGIRARVGLVVAYKPSDVLGEDNEKIRVKRALVIDVVDLEKALKRAPKADLRGANLRGANLYGADLRGADLYGADLSTALYVESAHADAYTRLPLGWVVTAGRIKKQR